MESPMPQPKDDLGKSLVALDQNTTLVAVIELSRSSWLVGGIVPGIDRHPEKKLAPDQEALLGLLHRWRDEAAKAGRTITRTAIAFEAGRDGFWLARWLGARGVEAHVIHPTSIPVSREHRRAKTGSAGYWAAQARLSRLAARRDGSLQHGRDPEFGRGGRQTAEP
jgi:transposase